MNSSLKLFIIFSVLLNILLVAVVAGHIGRCLLYSSSHPFAFTYSEIAESLPENRRAIFIDTMQHADDDSRGLQEQFDSSRKQAATLLKAQPFDKQAYLAQIKTTNDLRDSLAARIAETIAGLAQQFTPEERIILADVSQKYRAHLLHSHREQNQLPASN